MSRVTLTEDQYALFRQNQRQAGSGAPRKAGAPRVKKRKQDLPENIIECQIKTFLEMRGWQCLRLQAGTFAGLGPLIAALDKGLLITREMLYRSMVRIGEKGRADWLAMRPRRATGVDSLIEMPMHQIFFFECKAPGKKPQPEQLAWLQAQEQTGTPTAWFDDFEGDWDTSFLPWYRARYE